MRFHRVAVVSLSALLTLGLTQRNGASAAPAADAPTMDQIQKDYEAKKYPDVIKEVAVALPLSGDATKGYDKSALLALKGESHLQLKQIQPASEAYAAAAKESQDPAMGDMY